jgi:branched-chain amino acid transport system substrate-binding protein
MVKLEGATGAKMSTAIGRAVGCCTILFALCACGPQEPIRIGVIAGLSDRGSDFGQSVRDGVILAVENQNRAGGIQGRRIELVVRDDGQNKDQAIRSAQELIDLRPEIVIGPVTSSMAAVILPLMNQAGQVMISPTVASTDFYGKDDYFFRVNRSSREAAEDHAQVVFKRGARRVAMAFDTSNRTYSDAWVREFSNAFRALGGEVVEAAGFDSQSSPSFSETIRKMLASKPDWLLFVASSIDTVRLSQQSYRLAPGLPRSTTEWAASGEVLVEMGGAEVDGLVFSHAYDREDMSEEFRRFRSDFKSRFQRDIGSFSPIAYDTAKVVMAALAKRTRNESVKEALFKYGPYQGLQQKIEFDRNGDASRTVYFTEIRAGKFVQFR